jgi:hypothetical protein
MAIPGKTELCDFRGPVYEGKRKFNSNSRENETLIVQIYLTLV